MPAGSGLHGITAVMNLLTGPWLSNDFPITTSRTSFQFCHLGIFFPVHVQ